MPESDKCDKIVEIQNEDQYSISDATRESVLKMHAMGHTFDEIRADLNLPIDVVMEITTQEITQYRKIRKKYFVIDPIDKIKSEIFIRSTNSWRNMHNESIELANTISKTVKDFNEDTDEKKLEVNMKWYAMLERSKTTSAVIAQKFSSIGDSSADTGNKTLNYSSVVLNSINTDKSSSSKSSSSLQIDSDKLKDYE